MDAQGGTAKKSVTCYNLSSHSDCLLKEIGINGTY